MQKASRAFTLVELMVVLGIFAVLTSVVVYKYRDFNNNIILTNVAYEVGLLIRQAQVYGLSVRGVVVDSTQTFDRGYGVVVKANSNILTLCSDTTSDTGEPDKKCVLGDDLTIDSLMLPAGYTIDNICTKVTGANAVCKEAELSLVFVRPQPTAYIVSGTVDVDDKAEQAEIRIISPSGNTKTVLVWHTGQISVK